MEQWEESRGQDGPQSRATEQLSELSKPRRARGSRQPAAHVAGHGTPRPLVPTLQYSRTTDNGQRITDSG